MQMARSSTAVLRATAILDFIAEHPNQSFAMSELVRAINVSHSTCHSIVSALVEAGYLYRTKDRTYALGARLARISQAAGDRSTLLQVAKPELRHLADKFDLVCSALILEGDSCVIRERSTTARHVGTFAGLGRRLKLQAPVAAAFFVSSPERANEWLATLPKGDQDSAHRLLQAGVSFLRQHGYVAFLNDRDEIQKMAPHQRLDRANLPLKPAASIEADGVYDLSTIVAPVYDANGHVEFIVALGGSEFAVAGSAALAMAEELMLTTARISSFVLDPVRIGQAGQS